jgi:HEAT repeat protein
MLGLLCLVACCKSPDPQKRATPMSEPSPSLTPEDIDGRIRDATSGRGGPQGQAMRADAIRVLLDHADLSYPVLLVQVREHREQVPLIELLGHFNRTQSTPLFVELLDRGSPEARREAGLQLGGASDAAAFRALHDALASTSVDTLVGALAGFKVRADATACASARPLLAHADPEVRYGAVDTLSELHCLDAAELDRLARDDPDANVRELAKSRRPAP